ncbi:4Fe-4S ferredoxin iron-sulfur binding domain-containing protein [Ignisphaera aggregans DSM 17230]|uniref:4Fe-4S ferredoxin iron-sulfur binding domain-containing protein n=1 Tax=Ignisphaera aggregans (strain DSM 17230 / JCM 13409 / AQ1.S1) TaxID=583356 RepID=E0SRD0_IGNAA|nr:4Fe-4S ferredoxin iron-sulfur binding domain-containing protein [Ignisphaera aggregans DSM 17230]
MTMTKSKVLFASAVLEKLEKAASLPYKFAKLLEESPLKDMIAPGNIVAIKIHVGDMEHGGYRTIRPIFVKILVDYVKRLGGIPFLTDTWGLRHAIVGMENGYNYETVGAPIIPVSGIKETDLVRVRVPNPLRLEEAEIGSAVFYADVLINFAHSKGHPASGYGGAIKNIAMGCTGPNTRSAIHNLEKEDTIGRAFQEALADALHAAILNKPRKVFHINYVMDVAPTCDCAPWSDIPLVPDIGILASDDIVALEKATLDMINQAPIVPSSIAEKAGLKPGDNKFLVIHGKDPYIQIEAAYRKGLGNLDYEVIKV